MVSRHFLSVVWWWILLSILHHRLHCKGYLGSIHIHSQQYRVARCNFRLDFVQLDKLFLYILPRQFEDLSQQSYFGFSLPHRTQLSSQTSRSSNIRSLWYDDCSCDRISDFLLLPWPRFLFHISTSSSEPSVHSCSRNSPVFCGKVSDTQSLLLSCICLCQHCSSREILHSLLHSSGPDLWIQGVKRTLYLGWRQYLHTDCSPLTYHLSNIVRFHQHH